MANKKIKMKAPEGVSSATIEGHEYEVPKNGVITVISETHLETLKRHGFIDHLDDKDAEELLENIQNDPEKLVEFIEERGEDADTGMKLKKLRRLAREAAGLEEA